MNPLMKTFIFMQWKQNKNRNKLKQNAKELSDKLQVGNRIKQMAADAKIDTGAMCNHLTLETATVFFKK